VLPQQRLPTFSRHEHTTPRVLTQNLPGFLLSSYCHGNLSTTFPPPLTEVLGAPLTFFKSFGTVIRYMRNAPGFQVSVVSSIRAFQSVGRLQTTEMEYKSNVSVFVSVADQ